MRGITDVNGSRFAPAPPAGSAPPRGEPRGSGESRAPRESSGRSAGAGDVGRLGALGRIWEERGTRWAEAVRAHQAERRLTRFADNIGETRIKLEQFKLYPPYPVDEPRRAQAIRQFNGIAAEIRKLVDRQIPRVEFRPLLEHASTEEVEWVIEALDQVSTQIAGERASLTTGGPSDGEVAAALADSVGVGTTLGDRAGLNLSPRSGDALRQLA